MHNLMHSTRLCFAASDDNAGAPASDDARPVAPAIDRPAEPRNGPALGDNRPGNVNADKPAKRARKPRAAKPANAAKPAKPAKRRDDAPRFTHATAIADERYRGPSGFVRKRTGDGDGVSLETIPAKFSDRDHCGLSDIRDAYGRKPFLAANGDAGILARLVGHGYLVRYGTGGTTYRHNNGKRYLRGGSFIVTDAGAARKILPKAQRKHASIIG